MSYLIKKVGSASQDSTGNLPINLNDLSDVNTAPNNDEFLQYNGTNWTASTSPSELKDNSSYSYTTGNNESIYTASYYNTSFENPFLVIMRSVTTNSLQLLYKDSITGLTIVEKAYSSNSRYIERITVGTNINTLLQCDFCLAENSDATAYLDVQWQTSTGTALGPIVRIRRKGYNRQTVFGYISTGASTVDVGLKTITLSGNVAWPQSNATRQEFILTAKRTA
jgi:hypothetical protein